MGTWRSRTCPECDTGTDRPRDAAALCRAHLLARPIDEPARHEVAARLRGIRARMLRLTDSMAVDGAPAGPEEDAPWIEALGFFAGWGPPLWLAAG